MSIHELARTRRAWAASLFAPLMVAACADGTASDPAPPPAASQRAMLNCHASVAEQTVSCTAPGAETGANLLIVGGQGLYVRMTSSGVAYNGGTSTFSFNATVQNLTILPMATVDGATRHNDGVRVFLEADPSVTGGTGNVDVANETGSTTFTVGNQPYFQYGGQIGGVDQGELGADGVLATAEVSAPKVWQFTVDPTVAAFSFVVYVSTESPAGPVASAAPQVTAVSPATLVPGQTATLTGYNFNPTPASNVVLIGGSPATVTGGGASSLSVTVPCVSSGSVAVNVTQGGMRGRDRVHPLQVAQLDIPLGSAVVRTSAADSHCNELTAVGDSARYIVALFNTESTPGTAVGAQFSGDLEGALPAPAPVVAQRGGLQLPPLSLGEQMEAARARRADALHHRILEMNRQEHERLRVRFAGDPRMRASTDVMHRDPVAPPATRTFKVLNINGSSCSNYYVAAGTRVYYNGKIAIYEDDATPAGLKASASPAMQDYYNRIGDQFNADMEPVISTNFGNVLARDPITDNNGVLIAFFTPLINNNFSGVAGFVASCDQYPDTDAAEPAVGGPYVGAAGQNGGSNFGEVFYAYQPTSTGTGFSTVGTPDHWYRTIRSTFIHETKHVVSMASRATSGAPLEQSWLEEGTARHSEELWMRNAVDNVAWKGNTGYGSPLNPINLYCDARISGACVTTRRPAVLMQRHFFSLYTQMAGTNGALLSPFGRTPYDNQSYFYAISWSLVRYGIDRYGASDAAFLTALTQSTTNGMANLSARAGVGIDQLMGGWALSLAADDYPGLATPHIDIQIPTWNFRDIYAGINADGFSPVAYPLVPTAVSFGNFAPTNIAEIYGGGVRWFQISGDQQAPQLLRLLGNGGSTLPSGMRIAVARVR